MSTIAQRSGTFSGRFAGRGGEVHYREGDKELKIGWEMSRTPVSEICVGPLCFTKWTTPPKEEIPEEKQLEILSAFRSWLAAQKISSDVDLPADLSEDQNRCIWCGCEKQKLRNSAYCRWHFDLLCLRK